MPVMLVAASTHAGDNDGVMGLFNLIMGKVVGSDGMYPTAIERRHEHSWGHGRL